jgi:hypothetical protein
LLGIDIAPVHTERYFCITAPCLQLEKKGEGTFLSNEQTKKINKVIILFTLALLSLFAFPLTYLLTEEDRGVCIFSLNERTVYRVKKNATIPRSLKKL